MENGSSVSHLSVLAFGDGGLHAGVTVRVQHAPCPVMPTLQLCRLAAQALCSCPVPPPAVHKASPPREIPTEGAPPHRPRGRSPNPKPTTQPATNPPTGRHTSASRSLHTPLHRPLEPPKQAGEDLTSVPVSLAGQTSSSSPEPAALPILIPIPTQPHLPPKTQRCRPLCTSWVPARSQQRLSRGPASAADPGGGGPA